MTVAELSELRKSLRIGNFHYKVVKNTLAKKASGDTPVSAVQDSFKGPVGIAISYDDPVMIVKKILEYSRNNEKLKVRSGIIEGKLCTADELKAVAALPPRNVLLSMLAGALQSPLSRLYCAINATVNSFINIMNSLEDKREVLK